MLIDQVMNADPLATAVHAAEAAHTAVLVRKYAAAGKRIGIDHVPGLDKDGEVLAAYLECLKATRALAADCGEDTTAIDAEIDDTTKLI